MGQMLMSSWHDFAGGLVRTNCQSGVGVLVLDNVERKNAITVSMWRAIPQALHYLTDESGARVIIIRGGGEQDFSAGADIGEFDTHRKDAATGRIYEAMNSAALAAVRKCRVPTIAMIRGVCFGGGLGIAAACDLRIADEAARFALPAAKLGLAYPADAVQDLVATLGQQTAKLLLFTATPVSASRMLSGGFLLETMESTALEREVFHLATAVAGNAPLALDAGKMAIGAVVAQDNDQLREAEILGAETFDSLDYAEGRAAFAERRKPNFTGR